MTNLTKAEAQSIIEGLDYITLGDAKIELLSAILKLKQIVAAPVLHTVSITCTKADYRVPCIKLIRTISNNGLKDNGLKEAKDMLDEATSTRSADGILTFNTGGGTLTFQIDEIQLEKIRQSKSTSNSELAQFDVKVDGVPFRF